MCASRDDRPPNAQHGKHHHVCATHPFCGCPHWVAHTSRFLRCVRAAATGLRTHTWQTPPPVRHPIPSVNARHRPPPLRGAYIALFAMCASRDDRPPNAHTANKRHVCATHPLYGRRQAVSFLTSIFYLIDSSGHSRFVLRIPILVVSHLPWPHGRVAHTSRL